MTEAVEKGLAYAPFGSDVDARVLSVEVRRYDPTLMTQTLSHEFRVVPS